MRILYDTYVLTPRMTASAPRHVCRSCGRRCRSDELIPHARWHGSLELEPHGQLNLGMPSRDEPNICWYTTSVTPDRASIKHICDVCGYEVAGNDLRQHADRHGRTAK